MITCVRSTVTGKPCRYPVTLDYLDPPEIRALQSCTRHLTPEEKAHRADHQERLRARHQRTEPACWAWPVVTLDVDPAGDDVWEAFADWHDGRCAMCDATRSPRVVDHDHETGLVRGHLCVGCNLREGHGGGIAFDRYRERPPALILGVVLEYHDPLGRPVITARPGTADAAHDLADVYRSAAT